MNDSGLNEIKGMLLNKIQAYRETQIIYVAAKLKISDFLHERERTAEELAELTKTHRDSLYRLLRACTAMGLYGEKNKVFSLKEAGRLLLSDHPDSIRAVAIMRGEEVNWKPWGELLYAVKTGENAFRKVFNINLFAYYDKHPEAGNAFNGGMKIFTGYDIEFILKNYDFSQFKKVIDIGGGNGALLISILAKNNNCRGVLYDLPNVVGEAEKYLSASEVKNKIKIESGDMFKSIPEGGDCYILKKILHDWDDAHSLAVLKNCRKSISPAGRLLIIDYLITDHSHAGKINDIHMMLVCPGGKERTREEFDNLAIHAGFKITKVMANGGPAIIECKPEKP